MRTISTTTIISAHFCARSLISNNIRSLCTTSRHVPVMLEPILNLLTPNAETAQRELIFVDATFGRGGHTKGILEKFPRSVVVAVDCDEHAFIGEEQRKLLSHYGSRIIPIQGWFSNLSHLLQKHRIDSVDGILFDLGVSSPQLDCAERGFSFRHDGPLDMRMSRSQETTAESIVNRFDAESLCTIIARLGEEKRARKICEKLTQVRRHTPLLRTTELTEIIHRTLGNQRRKFTRRGDISKSIDPATRTFQALRMYVNRELPQLRLGLAQAENLLKSGGKLLVLSFHSLEDREVKFFLQFCSGKRARYEISPSIAMQRRREGDFVVPFEMTSRTLQNIGEAEDSFSTSGHVLLPTKQEILQNPRSRSAKLRTAERTSAPALVYPRISELSVMNIDPLFRPE